jgi:hypothetical protein
MLAILCFHIIKNNHMFNMSTYCKYILYVDKFSRISYLLIYKSYKKVFSESQNIIWCHSEDNLYVKQCWISQERSKSNSVTKYLILSICIFFTMLNHKQMMGTLFALNLLLPTGFVLLFTFVMYSIAQFRWDGNISTGSFCLKLNVLKYLAQKYCNNKIILLQVL